LNAQLVVQATSQDWFTSLPSPTFQFQGPDFNAVLDRFKGLDLQTIIAALQLIVGLVRSLDGSSGGSALAGILTKPLPLVNKSVAELLDVASDFANKVNEVLQNPAGAIQQLNNIIAGALGRTVPSIAVTTTTQGSPVANEVEQIAITNALAGTFTLTFTHQLKP